MQIHVVKSGDTLNSIASMYNTTVAAIIDANELREPFSIIVGESLVIPIIGSFYTVLPNDTLFTIAQKFGLNYLELANINQISPQSVLEVGNMIYIPPIPKKEIEVNAYAEPIGKDVSENLINSTNKAAKYLTYLGPFSFQILRDGTLKMPPLNEFLNIAKDNKVAPMMVVTNLEDGKFSGELGREILTNEEIQDTLLDNIISEAKKLSFRDVHFDMEFLPIDVKDRYINFLQKAKKRLKSEGLLMSVALAPKISSDQKGQWYEAHSYEEIGKIADFVVLMTYEWGYSGGPPRAVSPIDEVKKVVDYAVTAISPKKIMLGQNMYGYNWTLPYVPGAEYALAISPKAAIQLAKKVKVPIQYNEINQAPYFEYIDDEGKNHIVWFEDARSIQAKFNLIKEYGLRGISYWKLGLSFPQNWLLLEDNFNIIKQF